MSGTTKATCKVCGFTWTGFSACHCSRCHHTFTAIRAFDMHQVDNKTRCMNPAKSKRFHEYRPQVWGQADDRQGTDADSRLWMAAQRPE